MTIESKMNLTIPQNTSKMTLPPGYRLPGLAARLITAHRCGVFQAVFLCLHFGLPFALGCAMRGSRKARWVVIPGLLTSYGAALFLCD